MSFHIYSLQAIKLIGIYTLTVSVFLMLNILMLNKYYKLSLLLVIFSLVLYIIIPSILEEKK